MQIGSRFIREPFFFLPRDINMDINGDETLYKYMMFEGGFKNGKRF